LVGFVVSIFSEEHLRPLSAAITAGGGTLALVERGLVQEGTIKILDVSTGREIKSLIYGGSVRDLAFSLDGRYLAAGGGGDALAAAVWDYKAQESRISEVGHIDQEKLRRLDRAHTGQTLSSMGAHSKVGEAKKKDDEALLRLARLKNKQELDKLNTAAQQVSDYRDQGTITSVALDRRGAWMLTSASTKP
jgi:WD40 repeat protein